MKILLTVVLLMLSKLACADPVSFIQLWEFGYNSECEGTVFFDAESKRRQVITKYSLDTDTRWYQGFKRNKWGDIVEKFCYLRKGNWIYAVQIELKGLKTTETAFNVKSCGPSEASKNILICDP
jgi:hypothetical protein